MASLWLGVVFWPIALRWPIACWNSRSVSRVSRTNACRCLTSEARSSFVRVSGVRCISASTAAVTSSSLRMIMLLPPGRRKSSSAAVVAARSGWPALAVTLAVTLKELLLRREAARRWHVARLAVLNHRRALLDHMMLLDDGLALCFRHAHVRLHHHV